MARYIDGTALLNLFNSRNMTANEMYQALIDQPAADVVEVVRCKDCLFCLESYRHEHYCSAMTNANYVNLDHFCSCGKKK